MFQHRLILTESFLRDAHARLWSNPSPWLESPLHRRQVGDTIEWTRAPARSAGDLSGRATAPATLRVRLFPAALRHATWRFFEALSPGRDGRDGRPHRERVELALFHGRGCVGAVVNAGTTAPLHEVWLQGPRMETWLPGEDVADLSGDVPLDGRFSRYAGALGGAQVRDRIGDLAIAIVGVSRLGSLLAVAAAKAGVRQIALIDPDILEAHHLDAFETLGSAAIGAPKVDAVADFLTAIVPEVDILPVAAPVESVQAERALAAARVFVTAPDRGQPRLTTALLAAATQRVHLDLGTGVLGGPGVRDNVLAGTDVRLIVPGDGCLLCAGGLDLAERHEVDWRRERAGSMRSLNGMASSLGWFLLERLVAGDLTRSTWSRLTLQSNGELSAEHPRFAPRAQCGVCGSAGLGDSAWSDVG